MEGYLIGYLIIKKLFDTKKIIRIRIITDLFPGTITHVKFRKNLTSVYLIEINIIIHSTREHMYFQQELLMQYVLRSLDLNTVNGFSD